MKSAQLIDYHGLNPVAQALQEVRPESSVCIFAAMTEPLLASGDCRTIFAPVDPVFISLFESL